MYHRTQNENGTYNTRCLDCFMTIAFCLDSQEELAHFEAGHLCPEKLLAEMFALQQAEEAQKSGHCSHLHKTGSAQRASDDAAGGPPTATTY
jgi:hypothetical protein